MAIKWQWNAKKITQTPRSVCTGKLQGYRNDSSIRVGYERLIGTRAIALENTSSQTTLQTSSSQYCGGRRGRLALGPHELGLSDAYGQHAFAVSELTLGSQRGTLVPT
jgi:hypothetical protein